MAVMFEALGSDVGLVRGHLAKNLKFERFRHPNISA